MQPLVIELLAILEFSCVPPQIQPLSHCVTGYLRISLYTNGNVAVKSLSQWLYCDFSLYRCKGVVVKSLHCWLSYNFSLHGRKGVAVKSLSQWVSYNFSLKIFSNEKSSHLTLMMTSAQVVETSVTTTDNSPSQDYTHLDNQTTLILIISHHADTKEQLLSHCVTSSLIISHYTDAKEQLLSHWVTGYPKFPSIPTPVQPSSHRVTCYLNAGNIEVKSLPTKLEAIKILHIQTYKTTRFVITIILRISMRGEGMLRGQGKSHRF